MKKREVLKLIVASSAIAGSVGLSGNVVQADEIDKNINNDVKKNDTSEVSLHTTGKVINVNSNLRVRSDAGNDYDTIGYVYNGQEIKILSEKGDWYRISFEDKEGYVSKNYISIENNQVSTAEVGTIENKQDTLPNTKKGRVINVNSQLNIRQTADANSISLGTLKNGDTFEIISKVGDWYNIKSQDTVGFISAKYVQEITGNETTIDDVIQTMTESHEETKARSSLVSESGVVVNVASNLRVRSAASTSSEAIGYLLNGQGVSITGEESGWYKIDFNGHTGYVSKEYVQKGNASSQSAATEEADSGNGQVVNVSSTLNIRSGAGTGSSVVGYLRNGEIVNIIGKQGNWYRINYNGTTGYVSADYLQKTSAQTTNLVVVSTESNVSKAGHVVNVSSTLNIRSGAGTNYAVLGHLRNNENVTILGKEGNWYRISYNGTNGYVSADYIEEGAGASSNSGDSSSTSKAGHVVNVSSTLNIRSGAGTNYAVLGHLRNGENVSILGKEGNWYHISYNGTNGYVSADYIEEGAGASSNSGDSSST
ncbi:Uncharacterized conserved protein YgiM, contains N-terminal SH3 domain, DUF1202 family, partial [Clostridium sp. DSM 8431]|uniref:SH3 domain-containing protein n=1 Tax=Clostridium sp. DSM 8431 TaxID=1761781 RepID=UPI0008E3BFEC